jgi:hypothetical protein
MANDVAIQQTGLGIFDFAITVTEAGPGGGQVSIAQPGPHAETEREAG